MPNFFSKFFGKPSASLEPAERKAAVDPEERRRFRAQAQRLARPGNLLRTQGVGEPFAYWHGIDHDGGPCVSFRDGGQWLTVRLDSVDAVLVDTSGVPLVSPVPLYAEPYLSLPPLDAMTLLTGAEPSGAVAEEYELTWQGNCPVYRADVTAVMGGWNMPWPENDFEDLIESELLLWTLAESEPWVEVFRTGSRIHGFQRIT